MLLTVPLLLPMANALHVDLIHLGVVITANLALALYTPPVGGTLFVAARLAEGRPAVTNTQTYVDACRAVGYQHADLTAGGAQVHEWYASEGGMDLNALDGDCAALRAAAGAADEALRVVAEPLLTPKDKEETEYQANMGVQERRRVMNRWRKWWQANEAARREKRG